MNDSLGTWLSLASILGVLALAYFNLVNAKGIGINQKHKTRELTLSEFVSVNQALQAEVSRLNERVSNLESATGALNQKITWFRNRDKIRESRELTLSGTLVYHSIPLPPLPPLPDIE